MSEDGFDALLRRAFELPPSPNPPAAAELKRCSHCGLTTRSDRALCPADGHALLAATDARLGQVVAGHYRLVERLGSGGAGTVYRARHRVVGREVAVKFLRPELAHQPEHRVRLAREAQIIGQLHHENIVSVIDFAETDGEQLLLVMEYLRGRTLADAIRDGRFSARRAVRVTSQIARGLARAHQLDVLHRDIKPTNVFLCHVDQDPDFVKLLDFGIARMPVPMRLTVSNTVVGTPHYMSPEQARGHDLGPESDLYSLGCVMFEMLSGVPPFDGPMTTVLHAHVMQAPPQIAPLAPQAPASLCEVVMRLLQKNPESRYRDAHHLLEMLEALMQDLPREVGFSTLPRLPSRPSLSGPTASEQLELRWADQLEQYTDAAIDRYRDDLPPRLRDALTRAREGMTHVVTLRELLSAEFARGEAQAAEQRELGARLYSALDSLARDESTHSRELTDLELEVAGAEREQERALLALCRTATSDLTPPADGEQLTSARARSLSDLVRASRELASRSGLAAQLRLQRAQRGEARDDMRFQVAQLKGRIAMLHSEARTANDAAHARSSGLESRYQAELEAVAAALEEVGELV